MAVYAWGFGKNGQLGNGRKETTIVPSRVKCEKKIPLENFSVVVVSAGGLQTYTCTRDGRVFSFGCGKHGRLGTGDESDHCVATPVPALNGLKNVKISCGLWHGCAVTEDGTLFSWGYNKTHNVLGHDPRTLTFPSSPPRPVDSLSGVKIVGVACGNNFTLAWDDRGVAFSWGYGKHGVLGHGTEDDVILPRIIEKLSESCVVHMSAGFSHCGAVTNEGQVHMFGQGKYGALALGPKELNHSCTPTLVPHTEGIKFIQISCSVGEHHGHTLALTHTGVVYAWGDGYKGKLGLGDQEFRFCPTPIPGEEFHGEAVTQVSAGGIHSAAVTSSGHVYTWGCGSDGRLGHPEAAGHRYLFRSDTPRLVESLSDQGKAVQVAASYYHTVVLLEK